MGAKRGTAVPARLEAAYDKLDGDAAIRPTKIKCGDVWRRRSQAALLATPTERSLFEAEQEREKSKAFDLIDAMSRSGALSFEAASLHVVVAATHRFDLSLVDTVVQASRAPTRPTRTAAAPAAARARPPAPSASSRARG